MNNEQNNEQFQNSQNTNQVDSNQAAPQPAEPTLQVNETSNPGEKNEAPQYQNETPSYAQANTASPQIPRQTVYINKPQNYKKAKASPKARLGIGTAITLIITCVVLSGIAAAAGTFIANKYLGTGYDNNFINRDPSAPSVVFKSYETDEDRVVGTYKQVSDAVAHTVVEITTETISTDSVFWGGSYVKSGAGSGVVISEDGIIVTNNHVISGANTITVTLKDGTKYKAKLLGNDADSDIAIIKIEASGLAFALLGNSDNLGVGEEVIAVGNPLGELGGTVTNGIVSALSRAVEIDGTEMTLIQTNAAVNPGNSGGGLFNLYGELIGIVNAKSTSTSSGTSVEGIGFAIPINTVEKVANELINYGYVRGKVMIGIKYVDITNAYDAMFYNVRSLGLYVAESKYTDALKQGDRIVAINGEEVTYSDDLKSILKDCSVGDEITIKVVRQGKYHDVTVTLREYVPTNTAEDTDSSEFENNFNN